MEVKNVRAVQLQRFGDIDVLEYVEDAPIPNIQENQVLIKVHAAGVNPLDWRIRNGELALLLGRKFPIILGNDVSGTVVSVGSQVKRFKQGDEVFCLLDANSKPSRTGFAKSGGYAEFAVTREDTLAFKPTNMTHIQAASIPLAALTAFQALTERAHLLSGQKILINGASGGVGLFAVQIAIALGAEVTAVCSNRHIALIKELGVSHIIDYQKQDFKKINEQFDVIYDVVANTSWWPCRHLLTKNGVFISNIMSLDSLLATMLFPAMKIFGLSQKYTFAWVKSSGKDLAVISEWIKENKLKAFIDTSYPLTAVKQAHKMSESGKVQGKLVLQIQH